MHHPLVKPSLNSATSGEKLYRVPLTCACGQGRDALSEGYLSLACLDETSPQLLTPVTEAVANQQLFEFLII